MTQDTITAKKENTAPVQPGVPAAKEKEPAKAVHPPLSPEHEALVSGMYDHLVKTIRDYNPRSTRPTITQRIITAASYARTAPPSSPTPSPSRRSSPKS